MPKKVWPYVFLAPFLIAYLTFNMFPLLYILYISLTSWNGFGAMTFVGIHDSQSDCVADTCLDS